MIVPAREVTKGYLANMEHVAISPADENTERLFSTGLALLHDYLTKGSKPSVEKDEICTDALKMHWRLNNVIEKKGPENMTTTRRLCEKTRTTLQQIVAHNSNGHRTLTENGLHDIRQALTVTPDNTRNGTLVLFNYTPMK